MLSICSERKFRILLSIPLGTEMFHFPRCASSYKDSCWKQEGFPIRTFPGQRLFGTSPKLIAAISRPSSLLDTKVSTIHPLVLQGTLHTTRVCVHLRELLYTAVHFWVSPHTIIAWWGVRSRRTTYGTTFCLFTGDEKTWAVATPYSILNPVNVYLCCVPRLLEGTHNVPGGRRFHTRTLRRQTLSICLLSNMQSCSLADYTTLINNPQRRNFVGN